MVAVTRLLLLGGPADVVPTPRHHPAEDRETRTFASARHKLGRDWPGSAACDDRWVADGARERREAMRQLADLRRRLAVTEDALAEAQAASKRAEEAFDAASDRFDAAERALDEAREDRAQARRDRYAARQAHEKASATADRLARRVREASERLDRAAELAATPRRGPVRARPGDASPSRAGSRDSGRCDRPGQPGGTSTPQRQYPGDGPERASTR